MLLKLTSLYFLTVMLLMRLKPKAERISEEADLTNVDRNMGPFSFFCWLKVALFPLEMCTKICRYFDNVEKTQFHHFPIAETIGK